MSDMFPARVEIEIDRERLLGYLRVEWFIRWVVIFGFISGFIFMMTAGQTAQQAQYSNDSFGAIWSRTAPGVCVGWGFGLLLVVVLYFLTSYRIARRMAQSFRASVEGAFVRVRKEHLFLSDRKVHFRYITDYSVIQGPLMKKLGIMSLQMTTMQSNRPPYGPGGTLLILAVKECERMRDMLAEIDSLRENGYAEPPRPAEPSSTGASEGR